MLLLLPIYNKICNSDEKITPIQLFEMFNKIKKENNLSQIDLDLINLAYSFYNLGYLNQSKRRSISP